MKPNSYDSRTIITDVLDSCNGYVEQSVVIRALRAVCRYFGGQLIYIPKTKTTGDTTRELQGVIEDEVGYADGEKILEKIMSMLGGYQVYIPMEKGAFREIIAQEIYEADTAKRGDLCRKYGISFNQVYKLWHKGHNNKKQMLLDFEDE